MTDYRFNFTAHDLSRDKAEQILNEAIAIAEQEGGGISGGMVDEAQAAPSPEARVIQAAQEYMRLQSLQWNFDTKITNGMLDDAHKELREALDAYNTLEAEP